MATMKLCVTPGGPSPFVLNREKTYLSISFGVTSWVTSWSRLVPARLAVSVAEVGRSQPTRWVDFSKPAPTQAWGGMRFA